MQLVVIDKVVTKPKSFFFSFLNSFLAEAHGILVA